MSNQNGDIRRLKALVYLMGYSLIFGIFFICYILYKENEYFSSKFATNPTNKKVANCEHYNLELADDKIIAAFTVENTLVLLGSAKEKEQHIYKPIDCDGKVEMIGKIVYK